MCIMNFAYNVTVHPMTDKTQQFMNNANEICALLSIYTILCFTKFVPEEMHAFMGWVFIALQTITIMMNFSPVIFNLIRGCIKYFKRCAVLTKRCYIARCNCKKVRLQNRIERGFIKHVEKMEEKVERIEKEKADASRKESKRLCV